MLVCVVGEVIPRNGMDIDALKPLSCPGRSVKILEWNATPASVNPPALDTLQRKLHLFAGQSQDVGVSKFKRVGHRADYLQSPLIDIHFGAGAEVCYHRIVQRPGTIVISIQP